MVESFCRNKSDYLKRPAGSPRFIKTWGEDKYEFEKIVGDGSYGVVCKYKRITYNGKDVPQALALKFPIRGQSAILPGEFEMTQVAFQFQSMYPQYVLVSRLSDCKYRPDKKRTFMVTPFVEGRTLREEIKSIAKNKELKPSEKSRKIFAIFLKVCEKLKAWHEYKEGYIHGDIKEDNIMVTPTGEIFFIDFGLSQKMGKLVKCFDPKDAVEAIHIPPERKQGRNVQVDASAALDIYSLGNVMNRLLCGYNLNIPNEINSLLKQAQFEKCPRNRPSIDQFIIAITTFLRSDPPISLPSRSNSTFFFQLKKLVLKEEPSSAKRTTDNFSPCLVLKEKSPRTFDTKVI